jgi:hypothetical protein
MIAVVPITRQLSLTVSGTYFWTRIIACSSCGFWILDAIFKPLNAAACQRKIGLKPFRKYPKVEIRREFRLWWIEWVL